MLEKNIDGKALLRLTNEDISQLLIEEIDDGTIREAPVGVKSRFRILLTEWRMNNQHVTNFNESSTSIANEMSQSISLQPIEQEIIIENKPVEERTKKKRIKPTKREVMYSLDQEIEIEFFKNEAFLLHLHEFVKREIPSVNIEVDKSDDSSMNYTIKFNGTKDDIRLARRLVRSVLQSIQCHVYMPKNLISWNCRRKPREIIEKILNNDVGLFTVCQLKDQILKIYFVENEKFNPLNSRHRIEQIIQTEIVQEKILWTTRDNRNLVEHRSWKFQICPSETLSQDFQSLLNDLKQLHSVMSIDVHLPSIELFGAKKTVNNALETFRDLFAKHQLKKHQLDQFSSTEVSLSGLNEDFLKSVRNLLA